MRRALWLGVLSWALLRAAVGGAGRGGGEADDAPEPRSLRALVAVMTGFEEKYQRRREHSRLTWFPADAAEQERLAAEEGLMVQFAIGRPPEKYVTAVAQEEREFGPFLRIDIKDTYNRLTFKTVAFWEVVARLYDADYVVKVDDDSYVRLDRLAVAMGQWSEMQAEYIGCFKARDDSDNRLRLRTSRWYDPHWRLYEGDESKYAEGSFYVITGALVTALARSGLTFRLGGPSEDMMVGWILKATNATALDDRRLCLKRHCDPALIGFQWDHAVRDFLDPEWRMTTVCCPEGSCLEPAQRDADGLACMHMLHTRPECAGPTVPEGGSGELPLRSNMDLSGDFAYINA